MDRTLCCEGFGRNTTLKPLTVLHAEIQIVQSVGAHSVQKCGYSCMTVSLFHKNNRFRLSKPRSSTSRTYQVIPQTSWPLHTSVGTQTSPPDPQKRPLQRTSLPSLPPHLPLAPLPPPPRLFQPKLSPDRTVSFSDETSELGLSLSSREQVRFGFLLPSLLQTNSSTSTVLSLSPPCVAASVQTALAPRWRRCWGGEGVWSLGH